MRRSVGGRLFHRHALGQVSWLVDVAPARDGGVVGEKLKWYDRQQRLQWLSHVWNGDDMIAVAVDAVIALGRDGDDHAAARADLFDVTDDLVILIALRRHEH